MEYTLRPAKSSDAEFIYALNRATMKEHVAATWGPWDDEFQREYFFGRFKPEKNRIICVDGKPVGVYAHWGEFLANIQILPEWQGKGIGGGILRRAMAEGPVELQVLKVNPVKAWYERLGFRVTEETETHWQMRAEPT